MSNELLIAAEVLEKAAAYIEAVEAARQESEAAVRAKVAEDLKARLSVAAGDLPDAVVAKLASSDAEVVALVEKLADHLQAPESLGGPGEVQDEVVPRTKKEAAAAAADRFADWLNT